MRGSASAGSAASAPTNATTGALTGSSTTKTVVLCVIGGAGLSVILGLLLLVWIRSRREEPDLDTPLPNITSTTFPNNSFSSVVGAAATGSAQEYSVWKASGSSFASRDLPLTESARGKLNATTRSSVEYDLSERPSQIANISSRGTTSQPTQDHRGTNASSERSFSIRGFSEFSVLHGGDSESSALTYDRYSAASSRLSSDTGRSDSGWNQNQVSKNLDMHRFSSTSSRTSSAAARTNQPVSFINHDLTEPASARSIASESTSSRVDVPDWYSVIESPTDNERYTGERYTSSSLDSDNNSSNDRESFEL